MNPLYGETLSVLAHSTAMTKLAEAADLNVAVAAQHEQSQRCDAFFGKLLKFASERFGDGLLGKEANAIALASCAMSLRDTHAATGVKLAASFDQTASLLQKLACVAFTDSVLTEELLKAANEDTRTVQRLGREYGLAILGELLAT